MVTRQTYKDHGRGNLSAVVGVVRQKTEAKGPQRRTRMFTANCMTNTMCRFSHIKYLTCSTSNIRNPMCDVSHTNTELLNIQL